ncbi:MAG TPA: O-antigen ligase family protein [Thermoanaerobaculia bacterium]|nr:O-antigen ligase family protein [Thermoanaerobaculia bacterium]
MTRRKRGGKRSAAPADRHSAGEDTRPDALRRDQPGGDDQTAAAPRFGFTETLHRTIVVLFLVATPIVFWIPAKDPFGLPKEILSRLEGLLILALVGTAWILRGKLPPVGSRDPRILLPIAAVTWTAVAALFSDQPRASVSSVVTVSLAAVIFLATLHAARAIGSRFVHLAFIPAVINALLAWSQGGFGWNPIPMEGSARPGAPALLGNPNVAGAFLAVPALAAVAAVVAARPGRRLFPLLIAVVLFAGLLFTLTLTAIIAYLAGLLLLFLVRARGRALGIGIAILFVAVGLLALEPRMQKRFQKMQQAIETRSFDALVTFRLTAFVSAARMFADHPITGVGPGRFSWNYFHYKSVVESDYPRLFPHGPRPMAIFGDAHNDHLQVLAETGAPGYAILLIALAVVARETFRRRLPGLSTDDDRESIDSRKLARVLALPLAGCFAVLAMGQFPLQLAAPRLMILTFAAICLAWSEDAPPE